MIFEYRTAPMHYVEDTPAYKAGEWPGLKSNKFGPTRKVIMPITQGIIFNGIFIYNLENEPPIPPKRRLISQPQRKEYKFRPCLKIVLPEASQTHRNESLKILKPVITENKGRPEKLHYFKYKDEYINDIKEKEASKDNKMVVNDEMKFLSKIGYGKKSHDSLSNNTLLSLNFSKGNKIVFIYSV